MTIITAFTESFRPVGELCIASIKRHHKGRYAHEIIPDDFLPDYTLGDVPGMGMEERLEKMTKLIA